MWLPFSITCRRCSAFLFGLLEVFLDNLAGVLAIIDALPLGGEGHVDLFVGDLLLEGVGAPAGEVVKLEPDIGREYSELRRVLREKAGVGGWVAGAEKLVIVVALGRGGLAVDTPPGPCGIRCRPPA